VFRDGLIFLTVSVSFFFSGKKHMAAMAKNLGDFQQLRGWMG